jgi:hypothetical protein
MAGRNDHLEEVTISQDHLFQNRETRMSQTSITFNSLPGLIAVGNSGADVSQLPDLVPCLEDSFEDRVGPGTNEGDESFRDEEPMLGSTLSYTGPNISLPLEGLSTPAVQPAPMHPPPCIRQDLRRLWRGVDQSSQNERTAGSCNQSDASGSVVESQQAAPISQEHTYDHLQHQLSPYGRGASRPHDVYEEDSDVDSSLPELAESSSSDSDTQGTLTERDRQRVR